MHHSLLSPSTPIRLLALAVTLSACAPRRSPEAIAPATSVTSPCVIADTSAPTADTIRVVGLKGYEAAIASTDCQGQQLHIDASPVFLTIEPPTGSDMRDVLEGRLTSAGIPQPDLLISRRPEVIDFARRSPAHLVDTLPWSTTYLLVVTARDTTRLLPSPDEREALARDAVRAVARGAREPFPWLTAKSCLSDAATPTSSQPRPVIAYATDDPIGRQLAERIVSLAASSSPPAWLPPTLVGKRNLRVAPIAPDSLTIAPKTNRATATVIPISRDATTPCGLSSNFTLPHGAIPLVDIRDHVIIRRGSGAAILIDSRGVPHLIKRGAP